MAKGTWKVKPKANAALQKAFKKTGNAASAHKLANKQIKANKAAADKEKRKKQLSQLKDVLGAAAGLASGGGSVGGVSSTSQSYGSGPVPEDISPFDEEDTENAAGRL